MSKTFKDMPHRLGGQKHKYYCVNNHSSHGKFTKEMRRAVRADLKNKFVKTGELETKSKYKHIYFD